MNNNFHAAASRLVLILACIAITTSCSEYKIRSKPAEVPEIRPGILAGYLKPESLPNGRALLPAPPAAGSAAVALDKEVSRRGLALRGTPRWALATEDANLMFPAAAGTFSCALGVPITETDTPHLYMLLRRTLADAGLSTYSAKTHYQRKRPFIVNKKPICTPGDLDFLMKDGSYPSGHTAIGWAWALILSEIDPERANAILARGRAYGESRIICNVHWSSDVVEGRFMGAATVARLHADPVFLAELEAAKAEVAAVRAKGLKPTRNCRAEAEALANQPQPLKSQAQIPPFRQGDHPKNRTYVFECSDGYAFTARIEDQRAWLFLPNQSVSLPLVSADSGVTYGEGSIMFRITGGEAILDIGEVHYADCGNNRAKAIWEDAKFRGIDFRAVGNEPGWYLELTAGEQIVFVGDYGNTTITFVTPEPTVNQQARTTFYKVQNAEHDFAILLKGRSCRDSMSGEPFETSVSVILDGKEYRGCGKTLH